MNNNRPFCPHYGSTQTVTAGAASASIPLAKQDNQVRIINTGAALGYVRIGNGAVTATVADFAIEPNATAIITKSLNDDVLAHISPTGATLVISTGNGGWGW